MVRICGRLLRDWRIVWRISFRRSQWPQTNVPVYPILDNPVSRISRQLWNLEFSSRNPESRIQVTLTRNPETSSEPVHVPEIWNPPRGIQNPRLSWIILHGAIYSSDCKYAMFLWLDSGAKRGKSVCLQRNVTYRVDQSPMVSLMAWTPGYYFSSTLSLKLKTIRNDSSIKEWFQLTFGPFRPVIPRDPRLPIGP